MPVGVVGAEGDHRDRRPGGGEELRIGVAAAVVGHLQHVGPQVRAVAHQPGLGLGTEIAGQQQPEPADGHPDDEGQVVGLGGRGGPPRRRGENFQRRSTDHAPVAGHQHDVPGSGVPDDAVERRGPVVGRRKRAGGHHADRPPGERSGETADVVGIEVGEEDQRQLVDPQPVEAPVHRTDVGAGVDEHATAPSERQHQTVALPHVADHQRRSGGRPPVQGLAQRPAGDDEPGECGQGQRPQPGEPPERPAGSAQHRPESERTRRARRPAGRGVGQVGRVLGHQHQPAHGQPGDHDEGIGQGWCDHAGERGEQPQHRGGWHRRCGEQVRRQGHQAHRPRQPGDDRRRRQTRRSAHRHRVGRPVRPPVSAQPAGPTRGEQHDGRRRGHRERETGIPRQPGIDQQQDGHRRAERGQGRS